MATHPTLFHFLMTQRMRATSYSHADHAEPLNPESAGTVTECGRTWLASLYDGKTLLDVPCISNEQ